MSLLNFPVRSSLLQFFTFLFLLATSTLEDLTTRDSNTTSSSSTLSLNDQTLLNSTSTLVNNRSLSTRETPIRPLPTTNRPLLKLKNDSSEEKRSYASRSTVNPTKRQRRMVPSKNQRRLLQYELMPTGKVYYVDRPFYRDNLPVDHDESSSTILSTILSRSSSLDTLSDKHSRHRHQQQQQNRRVYPDLTIRKPEQKASIGGRLASNNNLPASSSFKPINLVKKKRFSSFEPTPESLDRVFDVLIAADKRREEHEFWKEKFDHRLTTVRPPLITNRMPVDTTTSHTIPFIRSKQTHLIPNAISDNRSQSYTSKRTSSYEPTNRQSGCLLEDCMRKRSSLLQQQQLQERNYSPNTIYSTNYPKQQLLPTTKPSLPTATKPPLPTTTTQQQQPTRILPLSNGRIGRAPQARQTSDELSTVSDVWAARTSVEDDPQQRKKNLNHARFQSTINRNRAPELKLTVPKRASSVEQQKNPRTQTKNPPTTKHKFFDLFKFNR